MKDLEFFDALTEIDDAYVLEAHESAAHHSPACFGGFRRAAVLIAAVMMLVVTAVAAGGDLGMVVSPLVRYRSDSYWYETVHREQSDTIDIDGTEHAYMIYTTMSPEHAVASMRLDSGEMLEVVYEADIRMRDGSIKEKSARKQGNGHVAVFLTSETDGEDGIILRTRVYFIRITAEGMRETVAYWMESMSPMFFEDETQNTTAEAVLPEGSDVVIVIPDRDE